MLPEHQRRSFLRDLRRPHIDNLRRTQICKKVNVECKKTDDCHYCGKLNGQVKKAGQHPLKIIHDQFKKFNASNSAKKVAPAAKVLFDRTFNEARKTIPEVDKNFKKAVDDMNPLRVLNLFRLIPASDCELLGMNPDEGRPEMFLWQYIPAPPVCIRPSVQQDAASTEDDLTSKLSDIVHVNTLILESLEKGQPVQTIMEQWDFLQIQLAMYVNSDVPGLVTPTYGKAIRGLCQRLKGKQGRFRGNLSGKRVDFSGRTVISPDPNLGIDEVAIPELVAKNLTYPEKVSRYNIDKLRGRIRNGVNKWPGANYVIKKNSNIKQYLKYGRPEVQAEHLKIGDVVERHLEDGDIVLFNRQPSLHKLSILSHYVKVRPHRTFRLNECVCNPYNADFDGDEMNVHVPQTEEARTEAIELMGVKHNLATPKNGEPIISAIQDFITAAYLLSSKDVFYDRKAFTNICMYMAGADMQLDLPPPTVLKPVMLWTGKQVFNVMMRPNKASPVLVNLDAACREYRASDMPRDLDVNDGWLCIRNSEVMCGVMDKTTIGSGKKDNVFYVILRDFGPDAAVQAMNRLAKLSARWLTNQGFSIGISDVYPPAILTAKKGKLVEEAYAECDDLIAKFKHGSLAKQEGADEETTMENRISGILSTVRQKAGNTCISELGKHNAAITMATSGSKGSNINVSQMVAVVGQQIIGGARVADGFQDRSLPHFPKNARQPPSKGFVRNSFFTGLNPTEFLFHAISGREGLVDTAVKTAETGYMSRRLMKSLEDLSTQYDDTVRNSSSNVIQFQYGDDKLDPVDMEGKAKPVHFERTFMHAESTTWNNDDQTLLPWEIMEICSTLLEPERSKLTRFSAEGHQLDYSDETDNGTDHLESARRFLLSIEEFMKDKAQNMSLARLFLGLSVGLDEDQAEDLAKARIILEKLAKQYKANEDDKRAAHIAKALGILDSLEGLNEIEYSALDTRPGRDAIDRIAKLSQATLKAFVVSCLQKYKRAQTEPGHAVGAVGAQSIGEPGTQMTLKTFHFAGVAGMSITQGVPRIKEIINASVNISTPIITCELNKNDSIIAARIVKGRIEKTYLRDVSAAIEDLWSREKCLIDIRLDHDTIGNLQLDVTPRDIATAIIKFKKLKIKAEDVYVYKNFIRLLIHAISSKASKTQAIEDHETFIRMQNIKRLLPDVIISGYPFASRVVIKTEEKPKNKLENKLLIEGYGLKDCMNTIGVQGLHTTTNSVMETNEVLGIEAARYTIVKEINAVMGDMDIDPRHMQLLADVMTYKGEVLGITRYGLSKMRDSVLQLASFEKTPDHLFEAAARMKRDKIEGVSECIILGQSMSVGTGGFQVVRGLNIEAGRIGKKQCVFEDAWGESKAR